VRYFNLGVMKEWDEIYWAALSAIAVIWDYG
jgi:hypothetical protein